MCEEVTYVRLYMGFDNVANKINPSYVQNDVFPVPGCRTFAFKAKGLVQVEWVIIDSFSLVNCNRERNLMS